MNPEQHQPSLDAASGKVRPESPALLLFRRAVLFAQRDWSLAVLIGLVAVFLFFDAVLFALFVPGADWGPLWVGAQMSWANAADAYDMQRVSALQEPLFGPVTERPFVYPPSALLLFAPLSLLPFTLSFALFVVVSLVLLERASLPFGSRMVLLLLAPPVVFAALAGQPTLIVTALVLFGLAKLDRNEHLAGVVFGIAAMIKPPLLLLAPIALAGGGYWRAIAAAGLSAVCMGAVSLVAFGIDAWLAWLSVLPAFRDLVMGSEPLLRNAVTPYAMAVRLNLPADMASAAAVLVAVPLAWLAFARTKDLAVRLVVLVGGGLLISPYAMNYELAALAPAVAAARLRKPGDLIVVLIWAASLFVTVSLAGLLAAYVWALARLLAHQRSTGGPAPAAAD